VRCVIENHKEDFNLLDLVFILDHFRVLVESKLVDTENFSNIEPSNIFPGPRMTPERQVVVPCSFPLWGRGRGRAITKFIE
jgi:hypothetical protein